MKRPARTLFWSLIALVILLAHPRAALAQEGTTFEAEFFGGATTNLQGSRAVVNVFDGRTTRTADSGERAALPSVGFAVTSWRRAFGSFFDFSVVDGGTASASI